MTYKILSILLISLNYLTRVQGSLTYASKEQLTNTNISLSCGISDNFHASTEPFRKILDKYYYIEPNREVDWFEALHICRELGADLVNIESDREMDALLNILNHSKCYWIDLTDLADRKVFRSITTGKIPSFVRWSNKVEPNNLGGNERCVQLIKFWSGTFAMNDNECEKRCFPLCVTKVPLQVAIVVW